MGKSKRIPINTRVYVGDDECGHRWAASPDDKPITSLDDIEGSPNRGQILTYPPRGHHVCIKSHRHVDDITNDDHRCCCGNTHDESE